VLTVKLFDCSVVLLCEVLVQHSVLEGLTVLFTSAAQPLSAVSTGRSQFMESCFGGPAYDALWA
jgi:hypothetical protein